MINKKAVIPPKQYIHLVAYLGTGLFNIFESGSEIWYRSSTHSAERTVMGFHGFRFIQTLALRYIPKAKTNPAVNNNVQRARGVYNPVFSPEIWQCRHGFWAGGGVMVLSGSSAWLITAAFKTDKLEAAVIGSIPVRSFDKEIAWTWVVIKANIPQNANTMVVGTIYRRNTFIIVNLNLVFDRTWRTSFVKYITFIIM